ncbi:TonB-dependent receptor [Flavobacterium zhairuonense]|uniref:outer membrane beta-barrel family protein n=1 Tax=Flavobacterium zhairuonense TaxID=2493631 RepID=UPI00104B756E|nr:outer membrane beta-barrel family protein [Flavobacterium zhairuonense]KAF2506897.1 TonB-dependent receptor [Flavobacterium zhairuonense]
MTRILIASIMLYSSSLFAQFTVKGKVATSEKIPYEVLEVQLTDIKSKIEKSELTNSNGQFFFLTKEGDYLLEIKYLNKIIWKKDIRLSNDLDFGEIVISENEESLKEVIVTGNKKLIERKVDRLVFNVENSINATGGDAVDALKLTPGIRLQNDVITMIGKSNLKLMINSRLIQVSGEDLISFLKTIPSSTIKNIEVITTPPAKYDAEGNSGIININLKKAINNSWSASLNGVYKQTTYATGSLGGNFSYQKNKISLVLNSNYSNGAYQGMESTDIYYPDQLWNSNVKSKNFTNLLSNRIGLDYQFSKRFTSGIQYMGSYSKPNINDGDNTYLTDNLGSNNGIIKTFGKSARSKDINTLNWHSNIVLDTLGRNITVDVDYLNYKSDNNRNFYSNTSNSNQEEIPNEYMSANNIAGQKINNYSAQIDVQHPFKWINLSYGTKLSFSKTSNDVSYYDTTNEIPVFDPSQSNLFDYKEDTQALYFAGNKKINAKWELQLGLRIENTQTEGNSITLNQINKNNYTKFFPTSYLTYTPNENHVYSLNYGKRIYRPNFKELNPFRWYSNPYAYTQGNPFLQPTYTHNLELNYSYKDYLNTSLVYSKDIDNSGQVVLVSDSDYTQKTTRLNYFNDYSFGLQQVYVYKKLKWLESQNTFYGYYLHSDSKIYPITPKSSEGFGATIGTLNTFTINKTKTILSGFDLQYNFPHQSSDLVYNYAFTQLNVFLRMLFLNKTLQATLAGNNLFKAYDYNNSSYRNNIESVNKGYYDSRYVRLTVSYKFGNSKINVPKRQVSNEDEKGRAN